MHICAAQLCRPPPYSFLPRATTGQRAVSCSAYACVFCDCVRTRPCVCLCGARAFACVCACLCAHAPRSAPLPAKPLPLLPSYLLPCWPWPSRAVFRAARLPAGIARWPSPCDQCCTVAVPLERMGPFRVAYYAATHLHMPRIGLHLRCNATITRVAVALAGAACRARRGPALRVRFAYGHMPCT